MILNPPTSVAFNILGLDIYFYGIFMAILVFVEAENIRIMLRKILTREYARLTSVPERETWEKNLASINQL